MSIVKYASLFEYKLSLDPVSYAAIARVVEPGGILSFAHPPDAPHAVLPGECEYSITYSVPCPLPELLSENLN